MEDPGSSHGKKFALLLAGTAAVALAAAYYSRRRSSKRSGNNQQALKLQKLLEKVSCCSLQAAESLHLHLPTVHLGSLHTVSACRSAQAVPKQNNVSCVCYAVPQES